MNNGFGILKNSLLRIEDVTYCLKNKSSGMVFCFTAQGTEQLGKSHTCQSEVKGRKQREKGWAADAKRIVSYSLVFSLAFFFFLRQDKAL